MGIGPGTRVALQNVDQNFTAPLSAIGAFSGGGGYVYEEDVGSSQTVNMTALAGTIVLWNSNAASAKTNYIPASIGSKNIITLVDIYGNAYTYNITAVPVSGPSIIGNAAVYTNGGSVTLYDSDIGWVYIG